MSAPVPTAPQPPPRPTPAGLLRGLWHFRPPPPRRMSFSARAGLAMGLPILAGWAAGDAGAGLMATLGGFTSLYCSNRPYAARAITLAGVALAFAICVLFGLWLEQWPALVVPVLVLVAMLATWLCNGVRLGPPGAYLFVLSCAAATAMPIQHLQPWQASLLVLAGGALAWLLQVSGALGRPRGPERDAVQHAGRRVAAWLAAHPRDHGKRRSAAQALHDSWQMLVGFQPIPARAGGELERLRAINRELHLVFARSHAEGEDPAHRQALLGRASALLEEAARPEIRRPRTLATSAVPHGYPHSWTLLREGLAPGSNALRVVLRVGLACALAAAVVASLDVQRTYWAMAAALLMLHQGLDWPHTVQRSLERTLGTCAGLLLAGLVLWLHPTGPWLALLVMLLQFAIEMLVVRNYALAVVFITSVALTLASGGQPVDDIPGLLLARGIDTLAGCACALLAFRLLPPRASARQLAAELARSLEAAAAACRVLAGGDVTSPAARATRRDLQHALFQLEQRLDEAVAGSHAERQDAEDWWPGIAIAQRLAYRVLAACWDAERHPDEHDGPASRPSGEEAGAVASLLDGLADACRNRRPPPPMPDLPGFLRKDLADLHEFLATNAG